MTATTGANLPNLFASQNFTGYKLFALGSSDLTIVNEAGADFAVAVTSRVDLDVDSASDTQVVRAIDTAGIATTHSCLLYTSPSPRDRSLSRMPSSA